MIDNVGKPSLSEEATEWLMRVRDNPDDPATRDAFEAWIMRSPDHRDEWARTCRAWAAARPAVYVRRAPAPSPSKRSWVARASVAAAACLCLGLIAPDLLLRLEADYFTPRAKIEHITLDDGSTVLLAPDSAIAIDFDDSIRQVKLLRGEAFFDVAHEDKRHFVVHGGGLDIDVLGTAFDVRIDGDTAMAALARGTIRARSDIAGGEVLLTPGQAVTLDPSAGTLQESAIDIDDIGTWREGRLYVVNETVASVVAQIQRYHPAWISLPDPALASRRVTGIYDLNAPDEALGALVDPYGGKVRRAGGYFRLVSRF